MVTEQTDVSTKQLSELLVLGIIAKLGKPKLSAVQTAINDATRNSQALFFTARPLSRVLQSYADIDQVRVDRSRPEPSYQLTSKGLAAVKLFRPVLRAFFPDLQAIRAGRVGRRPSR